jgi:hypothetical protein
MNSYNISFCKEDKSCLCGISSTLKNETNIKLKTFMTGTFCMSLIELELKSCYLFINHAFCHFCLSLKDTKNEKYRYSYLQIIRSITMLL